MELFKKTNFWYLTPIFSRAVTHSKIVRLTWFFFYMPRRLQWTFFVVWWISISKYLEAKMSKNWFSWRPSWILGAQNFFQLVTIFQFDNYIISLLCAKFSDFITKPTVFSRIVIFLLILKMLIRNSFLPITPWVLNKFW